MPSYPQAGVARFPKSAWALITYSNFMIEVQGLYRQGAGLLVAAGKMTPGPVERFAIFVREQVRIDMSMGLGFGCNERAAVAQPAS